MAEQDLGHLSERSGIILAALDEVLSHAWLELQMTNLRWSGAQDAAQESLQTVLSIVNLAYPARQKSDCTPMSLIRGSWKPREEPAPPALERWVVGCLSWVRDTSCIHAPGRRKHCSVGSFFMCFRFRRITCIVDL